MAGKYDVVSAMDLCIDLLVRCGEVIPEFGQKEQEVENYSIELGGSCCIFACQAAKLGLKAAGVGSVGDDFFGRIILDKLSQAQVITEHIKVDSSYKTGVGIALCRDDGDRAILTYSGTIDAVANTDLSDEILQKTRHIHIGSYYLMKKLQPYYVDILRKAKTYGVTVSLDTNWDPEELWEGGIWDILPYVDIFLPNENEILRITKTAAVEEAVKVLSDRVPIIAVKMGNKGALAFAGGKVFEGRPIDVEVMDTVGAGDSFDAGFVYGYLAGYSIEECLQIGCICGSLNTSRIGGVAGQPDLDRVKAIQLLMKAGQMIYVKDLIEKPY